MAFDTSFYLELSHRGSGRIAYLPAVVSAAAKAGFRLWTVSAIAEECINHLLHARPQLPYSAFRVAPEVRFATAFFRVAQLWPVIGRDLLEAGLMVRRVRAERPGTSSRGGPSLADALFALKVVGDPDLQLVVTDDPSDFGALAPGFGRRVMSVQEFIRTLGG